MSNIVIGVYKGIGDLLNCIRAVSAYPQYKFYVLVFGQASSVTSSFNLENCIFLDISYLRRKPYLILKFLKSLRFFSPKFFVVSPHCPIGQSSSFVTILFIILRLYFPHTKLFISRNEKLSFAIPGSLYIDKSLPLFIRELSILKNVDKPSSRFALSTLSSKSHLDIDRFKFILHLASSRIDKLLSNNKLIELINYLGVDEVLVIGHGNQLDNFNILNDSIPSIKVNFDDCVSIYRQNPRLITFDSFSAHLAELLNIRTFVISVSTDPYSYLSKRPFLKVMKSNVDMLSLSNNIKSFFQNL